MIRYLIIAQLLFAALQARCQSLTVNVPSSVSVGENFRLSYTVNTQDVDDFRVGGFPDALEVIIGPNMSQQSSFSMVNGHTSSTSSITYTYILCATKNGTYTIPSAYVMVNGRKHSSRTVKVKVQGTSRSNGTRHGQQGNDDRRPMRSAGSAITGKDLFIKVSANKTRVHEQEPVLLTYKVYTRVDLMSLEGKMPDLTGFHTQEIKLPQQKSFHLEHVNGQPYRCVTWSQYAMYPQITGKLNIPSITFNGTVVQQNRNIDPFEAFFNGGSGYVEVKHSVKAPGIAIFVDPLPQRPANFSGGVGVFNISAQMNKKEVKANDLVNIRVVVCGNGNLKLIKQPVIKLPGDFDKYDAKITDKTRLTQKGVEGNMIYDFLIVPRNQGTYQIPPIELVYYDTNSNAYKTVRTQAFTLKVAKGEGGSVSMADYNNFKNLDIRPLKKTDAENYDVSDLFFASTAYYIVVSLMLLVFGLMLVLLRNRMTKRADLVRTRGIKAGKMASRRLSEASKLMAQGSSDAFYDEVLSALWGYVADKLNIPKEQLTKENVAEQLASRGVDAPECALFVEAIEECEFERYAPGDTSSNMDKTMHKATEAITNIENKLNSKSRKSMKMKLIVLFALIVAQPHNVLALSTKDNADMEYSRGNYQQAIKDYEEIVKKTKSPSVYYNLGNAYYRSDNITRAIINYERAKLLAPSDGDVEFNLQLARSKTIDKIESKSEMFFVSWYRALVSVTNITGWTYVSIFSLAIGLSLVILFLLSRSVRWRKTGFLGAMAFLLLFVAANIFAYQQKKMLTSRNGAIVISSSASVRKTPSGSGAELFILHEGTRVDIVDDGMSQWKEVELADGRDGWMHVSQLEKI